MTDTAARGYHVVYRQDETNRCPGCGRSHWIVRNLTAECGFCATALPLENPTPTGGLWRVIVGSKGEEPIS